jgi:hypothetical protein
MTYDSTGYLQIRTFVAGEAIPISDVNIRITGIDEPNGGIDYSVLTDRDGITKFIPLPAPSIEYSLSPNPQEQPYSNYNVEAFANGFYSKKLFNVAIFGSSRSTLPIELIPNAGLINYVSEPKSSNTSIIYENEELE